MYHVSSIFGRLRLINVSGNIFSFQLFWVILMKILHNSIINTTDKIPVHQASIGKKVIF